MFRAVTARIEGRQNAADISIGSREGRTLARDQMSQDPAGHPVAPDKPSLCSPAATPRPPASPRPASPAAMGATLAEVPRGRPLTRADFARVPVLTHSGAELARHHRVASKALVPGGNLYLADDAAARWRNVAREARKVACSKLDISEVQDSIQHLNMTLSSAAPERLHTPFNYYPSAMVFDADGHLQNQPDDLGMGHHAFFEPLARLAYTARLDDAQAQTLLSGYTQARFARDATADERLMLRQANHLFNILYYGYFLDIAFDTPTDGTERGIARADAIAAADALLPRLCESQAVLTGTGLPKLAVSDTPGINKPAYSLSYLFR